VCKIIVQAAVCKTIVQASVCKIVQLVSKIIVHGAVCKTIVKHQCAKLMYKGVQNNCASCNFITIVQAAVGKTVVQLSTRAGSK
jgi:predicted polyphosphate/ATP-dependent NAD kinase